MPALKEWLTAQWPTPEWATLSRYFVADQFLFSTKWKLLITDTDYFIISLGNNPLLGIKFILFRFNTITSTRTMKNQNSLKIFILEDDSWYGNMLQHYLSLNPDYDVKRFESSREFFDRLHEKPDVVTLDYSMPDMDGSEVLKKIREVHPDIQVIIISGQEDVGTAISLLKNGAFDYIVKDDDTKDRIWNSILHLKEINGLRQEVEQLKEQVGKKYDYSKFLIGNSPAMEKVFSLIEKASRTNITVSITGETGTGKEW